MPSALGALASTQRPYAPTVLLLDDDERLLETLRAYLTQRGFRVTAVSRTEDALDTLGQREFDAVVSDVLLHGRSEGVAVLQAAREQKPDIVVVLMTAFPIVEDAVQAMRIGAATYLRKPLHPPSLSAFLYREIEVKRLQSSLFELDDLVRILSRIVSLTIEHVDPYTCGHGERAAQYSRKIGVRLDLTEEELHQLRLAAIAHDYGKIYLKDLGFLTKDGPLTEAERGEIMRHPQLGAEKLLVDERLTGVCSWIAEHHERFDGQGYPYGKKGDEISFPGRILGVVEVLDALATRRSYKAPWSVDRIKRYMAEESGCAFDPDVVAVLLDALEEEGAGFFVPEPTAEERKAPERRWQSRRPPL